MRPVDFLILSILIIGTLIYILLKNGYIPKKFRRRGSPPENLNRTEKTVLRVLESEGYKLGEIHPCIPVTYHHTTEKGSTKKEFIYVGNFTVRKGGGRYLVKIIKSEDQKAAKGQELRDKMLLDHLFFSPGGIIIYNIESNKIEKAGFALKGFYAIEKKFAGITFALLFSAALAYLIFYIITEVLNF